MSASTPGPADYAATIDRYIGYYEPYATSHLALDADRALQGEVRLAARHLVKAVVAYRANRRPPDGLGETDPRPK